MFFGRSDHTLDAKGRLFLPARHRPAFERGVFLTKSLDGCLSVYPPEEFETLITDLQEKARRGARERAILRSMVAGTFDSVPDKQGRVALPASLREYAGLTAEVVVVGGINHLELWNPERWAAKDAEGSQGLLEGEDAVADMAF